MDFFSQVLFPSSFDAKAKLTSSDSYIRGFLMFSRRVKSGINENFL